MNIEKMSLAELTDLHRRVGEMIPKAKAREIEAARKEIAAVAAKHGCTIADLVGTAPRKERKPKPGKATVQRDAKGIIWAGRGRKPRGFDSASAVPVNGSA